MSNTFFRYDLLTTMIKEIYTTKIRKITESQSRSVISSLELFDWIFG